MLLSGRAPPAQMKGGGLTAHSLVTALVAQQLHTRCKPASARHSLGPTRTAALLLPEHSPPPCRVCTQLHQPSALDAITPAPPPPPPPTTAGPHRRSGPHSERMQPGNLKSALAVAAVCGLIIAAACERCVGPAPRRACCAAALLWLGCSGRSCRLLYGSPSSLPLSRSSRPPPCTRRPHCRGALGGWEQPEAGRGMLLLLAADDLASWLNARSSASCLPAVAPARPVDARGPRRRLFERVHVEQHRQRSQVQRPVATQHSPSKSSMLSAAAHRLARQRSSAAQLAEAAAAHLGRGSAASAACSGGGCSAAAAAAARQQWGGAWSLHPRHRVATAAGSTDVTAALAKARRMAGPLGLLAGVFGSIVGVGGGVIIVPAIVSSCKSIPQR